jgi:hypothetical protein
MISIPLGQPKQSVLLCQHMPQHHRLTAQIREREPPSTQPLHQWFSSSGCLQPQRKMALPGHRRGPLP